MLYHGEGAEMIDMEKIKKFAEDNFDDMNFTHTRNVVELGLKIAEKEEADKEIVEAVAWLHDIGKIDKETTTGNHHLYSVKIAEKVLAEAGADEEFIKKVCQCIKEHMGPRGESFDKIVEKEGIEPEEFPRPSSKESKCAYDADMIDFMGPFGIAKVIFIRAKQGMGFSDAIKQRKQMTEDCLNDLQTDTGKEIGIKYYTIAKEFFKKLNMEE